MVTTEVTDEQQIISSNAMADCILQEAEEINTNAGNAIEPDSSPASGLQPPSECQKPAEPDGCSYLNSHITESVHTEPSYDMALLLGEGALARALEGKAEPFPQLPETDEERDAFEAEFQRAMQDLEASRAATSTSNNQQKEDGAPSASEEPATVAPSAEAVATSRAPSFHSAALAS